MHTPDVLEPGQITLGLGATAGMPARVDLDTGDAAESRADEKLPFRYSDTYLRFGVLSRMEFSLRMSGLAAGFGVESKVQALKTPMLTAVLLGAGFGTGGACFYGCFEQHLSTKYVGILAGTEHIFGGLKLTDYRYWQRESFECGDKDCPAVKGTYQRIIPSVSLGAADRKGKAGVIVEANTYFLPHPVVLISAAIQFHFN